MPSCQETVSFHYALQMSWRHEMQRENAYFLFIMRKRDSLVGGWCALQWGKSSWHILSIISDHCVGMHARKATMVKQCQRARGRETLRVHGWDQGSCSVRRSRTRHRKYFQEERKKERGEDGEEEKATTATRRKNAVRDFQGRWSIRIGAIFALGRF